MTTAASFTTAERIITAAMQDAGLLQEGDVPNSEQFAQYTNRLNDLINFEQTQGLKLWTQTDQSITLVAGTQTYQLGPGGSIMTTKPLRALQGYYLDTNSTRRPIYPLSWDEWMRLSNVAQTGAITQFFVNKQRANLEVSFWLVPDATAATGTAHLLLQQQVTNFTGLTDTMDFPPEWYMFLRWGLADDICTGQPQAIMDRCKERAQAYRTALQAWDVEDASTMFAPDHRQGGYMSSFR